MLRHQIIVWGSQAMNAEVHHDAIVEKQETSAMSKIQAVEFTLSPDQHTIIQHFLPKGFTLLERKSTKREKGLSQKLLDQEMSRFSGGYENADDGEGRSKRQKVKKTDRYLEEETPRTVKRNAEKVRLDDEMMKCMKILDLLKMQPQAEPFLRPVDPKNGAPHYYQIIKHPMDFHTIERHLKTGLYQSSTQFHADIAKVWHNSYRYNEKTSPVYKMTEQLQRYYNRLRQGDTPRAYQPKAKVKVSSERPMHQTGETVEDSNKDSAHNGDQDEASSRNA